MVPAGDFNNPYLFAILEGGDLFTLHDRLLSWERKIPGYQRVGAENREREEGFLFLPDKHERKKNEYWQ